MLTATQLSVMAAVFIIIVVVVSGKIQCVSWSYFTVMEQRSAAVRRLKSPHSQGKGIQ